LNKMPLYIRRLIIISTLTVLLDQATKYLVIKEMTVGQSIPIVNGFLNLTFVMNPGAAFGFLSSSAENFRVPFFLGVSAVAIGVVIFFYLKGAEGNTLLQIGLSLVLGGAIGNLIDRVRFKEVVDFIDVYIHRLHWPAFNVADSAITIGVSVLIIDMILAGRTKEVDE
jgi:signal peptidase II